MTRMMVQVLVLICLFVVGCGRPNAAAPQRSPDGTMSLATAVNQNKANPTRYLCVVVDIRDASGNAVYHKVTPASDRMRWSIGWVSNDEVLLKSSDIGDYHIRRQPDGTWKSDEWPGDSGTP